MRLRSDEGGGIILGWIFKLVLSLAIVGLVAFEAGAIVVTHVTADTGVNAIADEAAFVLARGGNARAAEEAARAEAAKQHVTLVAFSLAADRTSISVTVEKKAKTLLVHRISFTESWTVVKTTRQRRVQP